MNKQSFCKVRAVRKTKKECDCYWCGELIPTGTEKVRYSGVSEGDFSCSSFHTECEDALGDYQAKFGRDNEYYWPDSGTMVRGSVNQRI